MTEDTRSSNFQSLRFGEHLLQKFRILLEMSDSEKYFFWPWKNCHSICHQPIPWLGAGWLKVMDSKSHFQNMWVCDSDSMNIISRPSVAVLAGFCNSQISSARKCVWDFVHDLVRMFPKQLQILLCAPRLRHPTSWLIKACHFEWYLGNSKSVGNSEM